MLDHALHLKQRQIHGGPLKHFIWKYHPRFFYSISFVLIRAAANNRNPDHLII